LIYFRGHLEEILWRAFEILKVTFDISISSFEPLVISYTKDVY